MSEVRCEVCGSQIDIDISRHYISTDSDLIGLAKIAGGESPTLYDTFDCHVCGCQHIIQQRKRIWTGVTFKETRETIGDYVDDEDIEGENNEKTE